MYGRGESEAILLETPACSPIRAKRAKIQEERCRLGLNNQKRQILEVLRLLDRMTTGSLQTKEWWSSVKRAGGQGRQLSIPVIRDENSYEHSISITKEIATSFGRFFAKKCSFDGDNDFNESDVPHFPARCT